MFNLLVGSAIVLGLWYGMKWFARADPRKVGQYARYAGAAVAFGVAAVLFVRGRVDMAMLLGSVGAYLIGYGNVPLPDWMKRTIPTPGRSSRVRSAMIEMILDHDTGDMSGEVLAGRFAGRKLDSFSQTEFGDLVADCRADLDSLRLLEAYADRRFPGWRQNGERDADPGLRGHPRTGAMTKEEAYQILGLQPGAPEADIRAAHRALMKRVHPDQGGSTFLAAKVNEAKEVLLDGHK